VHSAALINGTATKSGSVNSGSSSRVNGLITRIVVAGCGRREDSDLLGRPVLSEAGDESALEDEDGDFSYSLADFLD
jgi:hypothetical protein